MRKYSVVVTIPNGFGKDKLFSSFNPEFFDNPDGLSDEELIINHILSTIQINIVRDDNEEIHNQKLLKKWKEERLIHQSNCD